MQGWRKGRDWELGEEVGQVGTEKEEWGWGSRRTQKWHWGRREEGKLLMEPR